MVSPIELLSFDIRPGEKAKRISLHQNFTFSKSLTVTIHIAIVAVLDQHQQMPVYGTSIEEHLRRSDREIAIVIEDCINVLAEFALEEEVSGDVIYC